jgi:hypothetical protein
VTDINLDTRTARPFSDLDARLAMSAAFLDDDVTVSPTAANRQVVVALALDAPFIADGPTQFWLQIRSALAGSEKSAEPATATAKAKT